MDKDFEIRPSGYDNTDCIIKTEQNLHGLVQSCAWKEWNELPAARRALLLLWLPHVSHGSSMFHSLRSVCASSYLLCFPTPLTSAFLSQSFPSASIILTVFCNCFPKILLSLPVSHHPITLFFFYNTSSEKTRETLRSAFWHHKMCKIIVCTDNLQDGMH